MPGFSVVVPRGDERIMVISGDIDIEHAEDFRSVGLLTLQSLNGNREGLIIDLAAVPFMDSTGLGALIAIRNAAEAEGRRVILRGLRPRVAKVLAITGLSDVFDIDLAEVEPH